MLKNSLRIQVRLIQVQEFSMNLDQAMLGLGTDDEYRLGYVEYGNFQ